MHFSMDIGGFLQIQLNSVSLFEYLLFRGETQ